MRQEVRLGGFGGQGIILAGYMLGKAAALYDGKEAVFTQAYGPEARGGACSADLVLCAQPIRDPPVSPRAPPRAAPPVPSSAPLRRAGTPAALCLRSSRA